MELFKERIFKFIEHEGLSIREFERKCGFSNGYFNKIKGDLSRGKINEIVKVFPQLNTVWVLTGSQNMLLVSEEGVMLKKSGIRPAVGASYPVRPFIDSAYAACGFPSGFSISINKGEYEGLSLPFMKDYDFSIKAKGDSMINRTNQGRSIREGDIVVCKLWTSRSHIRWGEVYVLATSDGVVVKKVMPGSREEAVKCISFNEEDGFLPYEIPLAEVFDWAIVVGTVSVTNWN